MGQLSATSDWTMFSVYVSFLLLPREMHYHYKKQAYQMFDIHLAEYQDLSALTYIFFKFQLSVTIMQVTVCCFNELVVFCFSLMITQFDDFLISLKAVYY